MFFEVMKVREAWLLDDFPSRPRLVGGRTAERWNSGMDDVITTMKARNLRPGDVVEIVFLDHAEHDAAADNGELEFAVYGRVVSTDMDKVLVETWCYANPNTPFDANVVRYTIIRGAIRKLTVLRRTNHRLGRRTPVSRLPLRARRRTPRLNHR